MQAPRFFLCSDRPRRVGKFGLLVPPNNIVALHFCCGRCPHQVHLLASGHADMLHFTWTDSLSSKDIVLAPSTCARKKNGIFDAKTRNRVVVPSLQHDHHKGFRYFGKEAKPAEQTLSVLIGSTETEISCGPKGAAKQVLIVTTDSKIAGLGRRGTSDICKRRCPKMNSLIANSDADERGKVRSIPIFS